MMAYGFRKEVLAKAGLFDFGAFLRDVALRQPTH